MKIKYLGPSPSVNVGGFGEHLKNQVADYPDDVAEELLSTSKKQRFEAVKTKKEEGDKKDTEVEA